MPRKSQNHQPSLFDAPAPRVKLCPARRNELASLLEALFRQIGGESVHEQDHR
jgi:hypothetical protein